MLVKKFLLSKDLGQLKHSLTTRTDDRGLPLRRFEWTSSSHTLHKKAVKYTIGDYL